MDEKKKTKSKAASAQSSSWYVKVNQKQVVINAKFKQVQVTKHYFIKLT